MSEPGKALKTDRERCYIARDAFFACSDRYLEQGLSEEQALKKCKTEKKLFDTDCPTSWVGHFVRKHNFERYKKKLAEEGLNILYKFGLFRSLASKVGNQPAKFKKVPVPTIAKNKKLLKTECLSYNGSKDSFPRIDFKLISENYKEPERDMSHTYPFRKLQIQRRCHLFPEIRDYIKNNLSTPMNSQILLEVLTSLLEAKIYGKSEDEDVILAQKIFEAQTIPMPPVIQHSFEALHLLITDPYNDKALSTLFKENMIHMGKMERLYAWSSLMCGQIERFKTIVSESKVDVTDPIVLYLLWKHIEGNKADPNDIACFLLDHLQKKKLMVDIDSFEKYFAPFLREIGELTKPELSDGTVVDEYILKTKNLNANDVQILEKDVLGWLTNLAKSGGSLGKSELSNFLQQVKIWKINGLKNKTKKSAIVVDALNTTCGRREKLNSFINSLTKKYFNVFVVIRKPLSESFFKQRFPGNVRFFSCNINSEDDLFTIYAGLAWGPTAKLLSNDLFRGHIARLEHTGSLSLSEWLNSSSLRFEKDDNNFNIMDLSKLQRSVKKLDNGVYLIPTEDKTLVPIKYHLFKLIKSPT